MKFHKAPAAYVEHVTIKVSDLEASLQFYTDVVGLKVLYKDINHVALTADGKTALLTLHELEHPEQKLRTTGLYHFALLLPDRSSLASFLLHISGQNVALGAGDHHVSEALYFNDPDGNGIEVYSDRDDAHWIWQGDMVYMGTEQLNTESIMAEYDPNWPWDGMPEDVVMGHLHLHVSNISEAVRFYSEGLGMDVVSKFGGQAAFLSFKHYHHHIAVNIWNGENASEPSANSVGLEEYVLKYPSKETLFNAVKRLENLSYEVTSSNEGYYSEDPSSNTVFLRY